MAILYGILIFVFFVTFPTVLQHEVDELRGYDYFLQNHKYWTDEIVTPGPQNTVTIYTYYKSRQRLPASGSHDLICEEGNVVSYYVDEWVYSGPPEGEDYFVPGNGASPGSFQARLPDDAIGRTCHYRFNVEIDTGNTLLNKKHTTNKFLVVDEEFLNNELEK